MPIHGYPGNIVTANTTAPSVNSASGVWTTEQQLQYQTAGNWPMAQTQISRSLRFNSADSAYLNRTPGSAGNRKTWTWSGWVKRSKITTFQQLFGCTPVSGSNTTWLGLAFTSGDALMVYGWSTTYRTTSALYRDVSGYYHILLSADTTSATANNRFRLYVNGVEVTAFATLNNPAQNDDTGINTATAHSIGSGLPYATDRYADYLLTEVNFIDGLALTPASFGFTDSTTGVWTPRQYTGPYGTNGFYLNFSDNSGTTSTTLGKDYSGNGNNWTPNNFSVTAGAGNDSLVDVPTLWGSDTGAGGEVRGNYCVINPLAKSSLATITNGNLDFSVTANGSTTNYGRTYASIAMPTGLWYAELVITNAANYLTTGVTSTPRNEPAGAGSFGAYADEYGFSSTTGTTYNNNTSVSYGTAFANNDILMMAYDANNGKIWWGKNGTWFNSGNPASGTNPAFSGLSGTQYLCAASNGSASASTGSWNFGQRPFAYTAPSGFKALCTTNLPEPSIKQGDDYFSVVTYTGNGAARSITGLDFQPDLVWIKSRSNTTWNALHDVVRGSTKELFSNDTSQEFTNADSVTSFNSNGFSLGADTSGGSVNVNNYTYVAWNWKANGTGVSNTAGSITSTVSANTTAGFSVGIYTGTGSNATVGHGLGVAPAMIIVKKRGQTSNWNVYHKNLTSANYYLVLNDTGGQVTTNDPWNNTAPTSTVFSIKGTAGDVNTNGQSHVFYAFSEVAGYSRFGSYTGNGSTDGPMVWCGFRPRWVLTKNSTTAGYSWILYDTSRLGYNAANDQLFPNASAAETSASGNQPIDILSNGFKIRNSTPNQNGNGDTYIFAAFAENPFKYALAR